MAKEKEETKEKATQIVGNTGMYYACYRLSQLGLNVMPTARNAKGIDILAYTPDAKKFVGIQVKSLSKKWGVPLGKTKDESSDYAPMGDYWIIVVLNEKPDCYILKPKEVAAGVETDSKGNHWLGYKVYAQKKYHEAWKRIKIKR